MMTRKKERRARVAYNRMRHSNIVRGRFDQLDVWLPPRAFSHLLGPAGRACMHAIRARRAMLARDLERQDERHYRDPRVSWFASQTHRRGPGWPTVEIRNPEVLAKIRAVRDRVRQRRQAIEEQNFAFMQSLP